MTTAVRSATATGWATATAIADGVATADGLGAAELASTTAGSVAGSTLGGSVGSIGWRRREGDRGRARCGGDDGQVDAAALHDEAERDPGGQHQDQDRGDVAFGTRTRPAGGLRVLERRGALEVPRAVRMRGAQADELLLARGLRARIADRRAAVAVVGLEERRDEVALELEPEERADRGIGRACGIVEDRQRGPRGWRRGCDLGRPGLGRGGPGLGPSLGVAIGGRRRPVAQVQPSR